MELINKSIVFPEVPCEGKLGVVFHDTQGNEIFPNVKDTTYAEIWEIYCNEWADTVRRYETEPGDFFNAWHYLNGHPAFWYFRHGPADSDPLPLSQRLHVKNLVHDYGIQHYITKNPGFPRSSGINRCISISVVKLNPENKHIEEEEHLNTKTEVWIELGKYSWPVEFDPKDHNTYDNTWHDYRLDCGGPTMETAIIRAAHNVWEVYGNDRRICDGPFDKLNYVTVLDSEEFDKLLAEMDDPGEVNERVRRAAQRLHELIGNIEDE